ncbi:MULTISPECIES: response regulator [Streptomyces]|uniref:response regulator n=1 Tax=Streptomyces TaxID=1883 RepID=UPI00163D1D51|nr:MULTISPECIES: response regulator transcription factor [Streptomyces]MBC2879048.1 response regulator transcription factor [Streptomyces sp. TYQ1024]UBI36094.1 response regulator transcription factor [Streptomyces mobaraensis]UKW28689.1 response regulator transcription factor [Streptomyces sp. TYQ1024]
MASAARPVRILLADDHTLFREGVAEILAASPGLEVVGEAHDGKGACDKAAELRPDVVLLDVEMPGQGVRETLAQLRAVAPGCRVVVLTMHDDVALARELLGLGAGAYLVKGSTRHELIAAIHSVQVERGPGHVILSVSRQGLDRLDRAPGESLSAREREVLALTAEALSNAQIARRLSIAEGTVKRHLRSIYGKLGAVSRMDAVNKAVTSSLIPPPLRRDGT